MIQHLNNLNYTPFHRAFKIYFDELGLEVEDWEALYEQFRASEGDELLVIEENDAVIAFLNFKEEALDHWFFSERFIFVREVWVKKIHRNQGLGSRLLEQVENLCKERGLYRVLLTTDTASSFYESQGYSESKAYRARNQDPVFTKDL